MSVESPRPTTSGKIDRLFKLSEQRQMEPVDITWNNLRGTLQMTSTPSGLSRFARVCFPDVLLDISIAQSQEYGYKESVSIVYRDGDSPVENRRALSRNETEKVNVILDDLKLAPSPAAQ